MMVGLMFCCCCGFLMSILVGEGLIFIVLFSHSFIFRTFAFVVLFILEMIGEEG